MSIDCDRAKIYRAPASRGLRPCVSTLVRRGLGLGAYGASRRIGLVRAEVRVGALGGRRRWRADANGRWAPPSDGAIVSVIWVVGEARVVPHEGPVLEPSTFVGLSPRLARIAACVLPGRPVVDLGTDHALVPVALLLAEVVPRVVAIDRSATVIAATRTRVRDLPLAERLELVVGDRLDAGGPVDAATAVLAGFGGDAIIRALDRGPLDGISRLVLQPQLDLARVRRYLPRRGLTLVDEHLCEDRGRFYVVMVAEPASPAPIGAHSLDLADVLYGPHLRRRGGEVFRRYLAAERQRTKSAKAAAVAAHVDATQLRELDARLAVIARLWVEL
ncbi:MAG: SAM-dependent methyltransferase [Myxococcales bacterium FL481]|nr:MAG: SAM-dependent methyltransferase [Myxococcales bacterium FL481]